MHGVISGANPGGDMLALAQCFLTRLGDSARLKQVSGPIHFAVAERSKSRVVAPCVFNGKVDYLKCDLK